MSNLTTEQSTERPSVSPDAIVDRLFQRLHAMYGAKWLDLWAGCPMDAVKAEWARALTGHEVEAVRLALEHLITAGSPFPPTMPEFISLVHQFKRRGPHAIAITDNRRDPPPAGFASLKAILARAQP